MKDNPRQYMVVPGEGAADVCCSRAERERERERSVCQWSLHMRRVL